MHRHIHNTTTHKSRALEATHVLSRPPMNEWTQEVCDIHYNGILFDFKKEKYLIHAIAWVNLEDTMLSEISQSKKRQML